MRTKVQCVSYNVHLRPLNREEVVSAKKVKIQHIFFQIPFELCIKVNHQKHFENKDDFNVSYFNQGPLLHVTAN